MKEEDYSRSVEVFSGSPWEAEIIKGLLEIISVVSSRMALWGH